MSLQATITSGLDTAWRAMGDLPRPITIRKPAVGSYDPQTQAHSVGTPDSFEATVVSDTGKVMEAISGGIGQAQATVKLGDKLVYLRAKEATFTPDADDLADYRGTAWRIVQAEDVADLGALYALHLTRIEG